MNSHQRILVLTEVDQAIAHLEAELADLRRLKQFLARPLDGQLKGKKPPTSTADTTEQITIEQRVTYPNLTRAEAAEAVLRQAGPGHPMTAGEISRRLVEDYGFPALTGRNLEKRLYTAMMKKPTVFVNIGKGAWTLREFAEAAKEV